MGNDARGILRPEEIGRAFSLELGDPPARLADVINHSWVVRWALPAGVSHRSEVLTHPSVHLVFEPQGASVYGVRRSIDVRELSGEGYAIGIKFKPGGFSAFTDEPVSGLTDRAVPLGEALGQLAADLERNLGDETGTGAVLRPTYELLESLRRPLDPNAELVGAAVEDMRRAEPGTLVADIAAQRAVSTRSLQRLFLRHVGVGPKWVLQRYRLHEALEQIPLQQGTDWSRLAADLGYFDQAHFSRDFHAVAGRSPTEYERERKAAA